MTGSFSLSNLEKAIALGHSRLLFSFSIQKDNYYGDFPISFTFRAMNGNGVVDDFGSSRTGPAGPADPEILFSVGGPYGLKEGDALLSQTRNQKAVHGAFRYLGT